MLLDRVKKLCDEYKSSRTALLHIVKPLFHEGKVGTWISVNGHHVTGKIVDAPSIYDPAFFVVDDPLDKYAVHYCSVIDNLKKRCPQKS